MPSNRPLVFVDLDDTLFQTARKMAPEAARHVATLDAQGQPNGFMNSVQQSFVSWLLATADVVPVTARSVEVLGRVDIPFTLGAICSHGAVILDAQGQRDESWHTHISSQLESFQQRLGALSERTLALGTEREMSLRGWVVEEFGLHTYVVTKHNETCDDVLQLIGQCVSDEGLLDGMYIHRNGNNLAFLPRQLNKRFAVQEWIRRDREINGERPILGFGDSFSDLAFMSECHWWATPRMSQIAASLREHCE